MNVLKKFPLLLIGAILFSSGFNIKVYAQAQHADLIPQSTPPSPDAAALGRYGETPVGTYTGIPNINIPLYEIETSKLTHEVSLSYHAGGIKVEDIASHVGLGWSLNAGGVITRTIQGLPDEKVDKGYLMNPLPATLTNLSENDKKQIANNKLDSQPDNFYFNFGAYSGKLIFDKNGDCFTIPHYKFKIKPGIGPKSIGTDTWVITTEEGTVYTFSEKEITETEEVFFDTRIVAIPANAYKKETITSAWYLSSIRAASTVEDITFSYYPLPVTYQYDIKSSASRYNTYDEETKQCGFSKACGQGDIRTVECEGNYTVYYDTKVKVKGRYLQKINFPGGDIQFTHSDRADLAGGFRTTSMLISDYNEILIKKYIFNNDQYFESGCSGPLCKRLKLASVTEIGKNNVRKPPYIFEYNNEKLPARDSYDKDHWGFFNKRDNKERYPEFVDYFNEDSHYDYLPGSNRRPNPTAAKAGVLTKITYPTGGFTSYEYELNEVVSDKLPHKTGNEFTVRIDGDDRTPNKESSTFTIKGYTSPGLFVKVAYQTTGCSVSSIPSIEDNCPAVEIIGVNQTTYKTVFQSGTRRENVFFLPNGQYKIKGSKARTGQTYFLNLKYEPEEKSVNKFAGGLRLKRMVESDGKNPLVSIVKKYNYNDEDGKSTGRISSFPKYHYNYFYWGEFGCTPELPEYCWLVPTLVIGQETNTTLGTTRDSYVGYGKVTELNGDQGEQGKTEYFYTSIWASENEGSTRYFDKDVSDLPFGPPKTDNDWLRGFLQRQVDYKYDPYKYPKPYVTIREIINEYAETGSRYEIQGLKISVAKEQARCYPSTFPAIYATSLLQRYGRVANDLKYMEIRDYNVTGDGYITNKTEYSYHPDTRQITQTITITPDTKKRISKFKYPLDYTITSVTDDMSRAIQNMIVKNIHTNVIEEQSWVGSSTVNKLTGAKINMYYKNGTDISEQWEFLTDKGQENYQGSFIDAAGNFKFSNTQFRKLVSYDKYSENGRLLQLTKSGGVRKSFLWGYKDLFQIAEVSNAEYNNVAFTSFEKEDSGNWIFNSNGVISVDAATGTHSFKGVVTTNLDFQPGSYVISFWARGKGDVIVNNKTIAIDSEQWERFETTITTELIQKININSGAASIDELRLHPENSQMKSFTYSINANNIVAENDASNSLLKYEYDDLQRLHLIRDESDNILNRYSYVYDNSNSGLNTNINADFTISGQLNPNQPITFTAINTDPSVEFEWHLGDGTVIRNGSKTVTHKYLDDGGFFVQMRVKKGDLGNSMIKSVIIKRPATSAGDWPAPSITNVVGKRVVIPIPAYFKITATAVASEIGGEKPYLRYVWRVTDLDGKDVPISLLPGQEFSTTTNNVEITFYKSFPALQYNLHCRVVDANGVYSKEVIKLVTASYK